MINSTVYDVVTRETSGKMKTIKKEEFMELLNILKSRLSNFTNSLETMLPSDRKRLLVRIQESAKTQKGFFCNTYVKMATTLKEDNKSAFEQYLLVAHNINKVLSNFERKIDNIFSEKAITIYNAKISNLSALAVVDQSEQFINFACYMLDGIFCEIVTIGNKSELVSPKPYRLKYISEHQDRMTNFMVNTSSSSTFNLIVAAININPKDDTRVIGNDNQLNESFVKETQSRGFLQYALGAFSYIFRYIGEQWNIFKNYKYQKNVKEKEWLAAHVALLQLQLAEVNPDDDEYRRLVKIIDSYNEMITKLDIQINEYLAD